jgi:hypothetical protein
MLMTSIMMMMMIIIIMAYDCRNCCINFCIHTFFVLKILLACGIRITLLEEAGGNRGG